jgi:hypothetical protein
VFPFGLAILVLTACGSGESGTGSSGTVDDLSSTEAPSTTTASTLDRQVPLSSSVNTTPPGKAVPFRSLAAAEFPGDGPAEARLYVVRAVGDLAPFENFLLDGDARLARNVDYSSRLLLAVFRGPSGMSGSPITVRSVTLEDSQLHVVASVRRAAGDSVGHAAITTAYHLVTVSRADVGSPPAEGELVVV